MKSMESSLLYAPRNSLYSTMSSFVPCAMDNPAPVRTEWIVRLAEVVLTDGLDDDKPILLRFLEPEQGREIDSLLQQVFRGEVGKEIDRKKAFGREPGLRTGAALVLVQRGDTSIKPEIERMLRENQAQPDRAALEVCLALLGDPAYIKVEHFRLRFLRL